MKPIQFLKFLSVLILTILINTNSYAEGTKQLWPSGVATEKVGLMMWRFPGSGAPLVPFATYGALEGQRLNIHIENTTEKIYYGLNVDPSGFSGDVYYRIVDPTGAVVFGPAIVPTSGAGFISNHAEAIAGPDILSTSGYVSLNYQPLMTGDYYIEFNPQNPTVQQQIDTRFQFFDITVMNGIYERPGRLWSRNWELCQFNFTNRTYSEVFIYSTDGIVSKLSFNGMQAYGFEVHCNGTGPMNTGSPALDRQSQSGDVNYYDYKIFLQDPDPAVYPTGIFSTFGAGPAYLSGCSGSYCINVDYSGSGYSEILLDFDSDGTQDPEDVLLTANVPGVGYYCFPWDGRDGNGVIVNHAFSMGLEATLLAGITHYPVYDAENNIDGFQVSTVRPVVPNPVLLYDDTPIGGGSDLTGCIAPCHTWNSNFGNVVTINTWWWGASVSSIVTILNNQCDPVANNDVYVAYYETPENLDVLVNDSDSDGDLINVVSSGTDLTNGMTYAGGTIVINDNGTPGDLTDDFFVYSPPNGWFGLDSVDYFINDEQGGRDTATIYIYVDFDLDQDGLNAGLDLDSDNDGILDTDEDGGIGFAGLDDADGDGIPNFLDFSDLTAGFPPFVDSNNDGTNDVFDTDLDGSPDCLDLDSDNDGIPDAVEANGGIEPAGYDISFGQIVGPDTDGDGLLDSVDNDPTVAYGAGSTSPIPNSDSDGDGVTDATDLDSDNDGIYDLVEVGGADIDNDGLYDNFQDVNNDGYFDGSNFAYLIIGDPDADGLANYIDIDSDGDGNDDSREGFATVDDPTGFTYTDTDGDGLIDQFDSDNGGTNAIPVDTDFDGIPDFLDEDSDGDGTNDIIENNDANFDGVADSSPSGNDTDGDGLDDAFDTTPGLFGGESTVPEQNQDGDAQPDWRDLNDTFNQGIFYFVCDATNELYSIDPSAGTTSLIGGLGVPSIEAIAYWDGVLYGANQGTFGTINTSTGVYSNLGQVDGGGTANGVVGSQTLNDIDGLSFDPWTGVLWASCRRNGDFDLLFHINPVTGLFVPNAFGTGLDYIVVDGTGVFDDVDDIAVSPINGKIYAVGNDGSQDQILEVNKQTGVITIVAPASQSNVEGMSYYNDGTFYSTIGSNPGQFWEVDPNTGVFSNQIILPCGDPEAVAALVAPPNHITGQMWDDANSDGILDVGETGLSGVSIDLYYDVNGNGIIDASDTYLQTEVTDGTGAYSFTFATTGELLIAVDESTLPPGYSLTTDNIEDATFVDNFNFNELDQNNNFGAGVGPDCDGDGIPDFAEGGIGADMDGDGVDNMCDLDSDNDGILDSDELNEDTDLDGIADYLDLDSDNDGIPDAIEANSGVAIASFVTTGGYLSGVDGDGDGLIDAVDADPTGAYGAGSVSLLANPDTDGDGVFDHEDLDSDNDGIVDLVEATDNPYISIGVNIDADQDGQVDNFTDGNNDGYHDVYAATPLTIPNSDGNGNPNYLDFDSDDDGIDDTTEGLTTLGYAQPTVYTDADGDGIIDFWDTDFGGTYINVVDTDGDGTPDFFDLDSDDDSVLDIIEGNDNNQDGIADSSPSGNDADGDGLDDAFDANCITPSNWGCATLVPHQDSDADGQHDWRDIDDDNDGIQTSDETIDVNANGTPDYLEASPCPIGQTLQINSNIQSVPTIYSTSNISDANNATGLPNGTEASYDAVNSYIIFDYGTNVPAGTPVTITWRSDAGSSTFTVGEWIGSWDVQGSFSTTSTTFTTTIYTSGNTHRYMYIQQTGGSLLYVDAVTYDIGTTSCEDDFDMDGIPNSIDEDDDNDGISDLVEGTGDTDGDLIPDYLDLDSDNDGIVDAIEANAGVLPANMSSEGQYNLAYVVANDTDNDGWVETSEGGAGYANAVSIPLDSDSDGVVDWNDLDSDGDGILDIVEANEGVLPINANTNGQYPGAFVDLNDADNDGLIDEIDADQGGTASPNSDIDGDGIPNYLDLDSDGDNVNDEFEGFDPDVTATGNDTDSDGLDDAYDPDQAGTLANLPDEDCNGLVDYLDGVKNTLITGNFGTSSTWSNGVIPVPGKTIMVRTGHTLNLTGNYTVASVTVQNGGVLNLNGNTLTVTGFFHIDGDFNHGNGKVIFQGFCTQSICGDMEFYDVEFDNSNGANVNCGDVSVVNELELTDGILSACMANSFTLQSSSAGTAFIAGSGTGSVICNVTVERYKEGCADGWISLATPFSNNTFNDWDDEITTAGFPGSDFPTFSFESILSYNEPTPGPLTNGFFAPTSINDAIIRGKGYQVYEGMANYPLIAEVTGEVDLLNFTFPLDHTNNGLTPADGWNLLGNPFPSAIDWDVTNNAKWINVGCCNATYIWNECVDQYASYISSVGTNGGTNVIPSSSAFWIKAHFPGASLTCTRESMTSDYGDFRAQNNVDAAFTMHVDGFSKEDEVKFRVLSTASHGHDDFGDALKSISDETNMGIYITDNVMGMKNSIEAFPNDGVAKTIPVWLRVPHTGSYTFDFSGGANLPSDMCFIFEDMVTGNTVDLKTGTYYTFNMDSLVNFENRFNVNVSYPVQPLVNHLTCAGAHDGSVIFEANGVGPYDVIWKDVNGNIVRQVNTMFNDTLSNIPAGDYELTIIDNGAGSCGNVTVLVNVNEPSNALSVNGIVLNQQCDGSNGSINATVNGGALPYSYSWSSGESIQDLTNVLPGQYALQVTDDNGCVMNQNFTVNPAPSVSANFSLTSTTIDLNDDGTVSPYNSSTASNYVWYWGDGNVSVGAQPQYEYTLPGTYEIQLIASIAGCTDTLTQMVDVIGNATGVAEEINNGNVSYNNGMFEVNFPTALNTTGQVQVFDVNGRLVHTESILSGVNFVQFNIANLSSGMYHIMATSGTNEISEKIIVTD